MSFLTNLTLAAINGVPSAPPAIPAGNPAPAWLIYLQQYGTIILIVVFFYVFVLGSKRKQDRARKLLLDNLKKGDSVRLVGGEFGTVVDVRGAKVLIKVDESSNTKILYAREAVQSVEIKDAKDEVTK